MSKYLNSICRRKSNFKSGGRALNTLFKALADPTRRKILELLREKDLRAGEIARAFDISKPSVSHHLNMLRQSGLVLSERDGQNIIYSLNTTVFQEVLSWIYDLKGEKNENKTKKP